MKTQSKEFCCAQPDAGGPRQQCAAPLPWSLQEHRIQTGRHDGHLRPRPFPSSPQQHGVSSSVSFPPPLFHFALSALAWFDVWVLHPPVLGCDQTIPTTSPLPRTHLSQLVFHFFLPVPFSIFSVSLCSSVFTADFALK